MPGWHQRGRLSPSLHPACIQGVYPQEIVKGKVGVKVGLK